MKRTVNVVWVVGVFLAALFSLTIDVSASDIYISANGAGAGAACIAQGCVVATTHSNPSCLGNSPPPETAPCIATCATAGNSCANALSLGYADATNCSFPVNWGTGATIGSYGPQIVAGTTIHLCGTLSTLFVQGSGISGQPITILFEPGAKISLPVGIGIYMAGQSNVTIDGGCVGGCNGIIENTANGTGLANQVGTFAIQGGNASNTEIKNLLIQNLYVHIPNDTTIDPTTSAAFYAQNQSGYFLFHDNVVHDLSWAIELIGLGNPGTVNIYNNNIYNIDHGIVPNAQPGDSATINIYNNHIHDTANWDTGVADKYHHDGIHYFGSTANVAAMNVYNNLFDGNWGGNNTAHIFMNTQPPNVTMFNNIFIQYPGDTLGNGFVGNMGGANFRFINNTMIGTGAVNNSLCDIINNESNSMIRNNVITGCNVMITTSGTLGTFAAGGFNNNVYANYAPGGNGSFPIPGCVGGACSITGTPAFLQWQAASGYDGASTSTASALLTATGFPMLGSPVIGFGANLTGLGIAALDSDYVGTPRSPFGAWDVGAYTYTAAGAASGAITAPGLNAALVYPNPVTAPNDPTIRICPGGPVSGGGDISVTIFDVSGKVVNSSSNFNFIGVPIQGVGTGQFVCYEYTWTGHKSSGAYFAVVHAKVNGTTVKARVKFAVVR